MLRTALLLLCMGVALGSKLQAWKTIWDHWELDRGLPEDCRAEPCLEKCDGEDEQNLFSGRYITVPRNGVRCTSGNITSVDVNPNWDNAIIKIKKIPAAIGNLTQLQYLSLPSNQLTSLPPEIGQLQQLHTLYLYSNQLTSLPPEIGQLQQLQYLSLPSNQLTTLPPEIGQLQQLQNLNLNSNQLTSLPQEIGQLQQLYNLDIGYNQLKWPAPKLLAFCRDSRKYCVGVPPNSCSAFGHMELSLDMTSCVACDYSPEVTIVLLVVLGLFGIFGFLKLQKLMNENPGSLGGSLASISILSSHAQMINVVLRMDLEWPYEVEQSKSVLEGFYMNLPSMVRLQCLSADFLPIFWLCILSLFVLLILYPKAVKEFQCNVNDQQRRFDRIYNTIGLMMSLLATTFAKVMHGVGIGGEGRVFVDVLVSLLLLYVFFKLLREMLVLQGSWDGGIRYSCLQPLRLPKERLQRRLEYLVERFAENATYWQFVIWFRQISILLCCWYVEDNGVVAALVLLVCLLSLVLHQRIKPFKFEFQNIVEAWLLVVNMVLVILAFLFSEVWKPNRDQVGYWILTIAMLLLIFGSLIFGIVRLRLWKAVVENFKKMWRNETKQETEAKEAEAEEAAAVEIQAAKIRVRI